MRHSYGVTEIHGDKASVKLVGSSVQNAAPDDGNQILPRQAAIPSSCPLCISYKNGSHISRAYV